MYWYFFLLSLLCFTIFSLSQTTAQTTYAHSNFSRINSIDAIWKEADTSRIKKHCVYAEWKRFRLSLHLAQCEWDWARERGKWKTWETSKKYGDLAAAVALEWGTTLNSMSHTHRRTVPRKVIHSLYWVNFCPPHNRLIEKWFMVKSRGKFCSSI